MTVVHLWWHTPELPAAAAANVARWQEVWPDATVRVWHAEPELAAVAGLAFHTAGNVAPIDHVRHTANLVRWALLAEHGGLWADVDIEPLGPFTPTVDLTRPFCASLGAVCEPAVVGGPAGHPLWTDLLVTAAERGGRSPWVSGAHLLTFVGARHGIVAHPPGRFFDVDAYGRPVPDPADGVRLARHGWWTSARR